MIPLIELSGYAEALQLLVRRSSNAELYCTGIRESISSTIRNTKILFFEEKKQVEVIVFDLEHSFCSK